MCISADPCVRSFSDPDSSDGDTYGKQEGTAASGYFRCRCYHPLFCFNQYGDLERVMLRNGNVHGADDWQALLGPVVARYRGRDIRSFFRGDAAFAQPAIYRFLEEEGYLYAIRLKANPVLADKIAPLLTRPVGRPPRRPVIRYASFLYRASSWEKPRRVVAKVEWHKGELFPRTGFIVTNLRRAREKVVKFRERTGDSQAVDQGGQARAPVDEAVLP